MLEFYFASYLERLDLLLRPSGEGGAMAHARLMKYWSVWLGAVC
jgi:hypothetical protein